MALAHGRKTVIIIDNNNISPYCDSSSLETAVDEHDVTCYGAEDHVVAGGLGAGKMSMGGKYDNTSAGPKAVLEPLIDAKETVTLIRRTEGTGSGLPQESMSVLLTKYVETNPVADMVTWSCDMTRSGAITRTTQA